MANNTAGQFGMQIVFRGGAEEMVDKHLGDGSTTWKNGDLCRINTSNQVVDAAVSTATSAPIYGMVIEDWDTAPTTSQYVRVMKFAHDTILQTQVWHTTPASAVPSATTPGEVRQLKNVAAGKWAIDIETAVTDGIATVEAAGPSIAKWMDVQMGTSIQYGVVFISFTQALLDEAYAA